MKRRCPYIKAYWICFANSVKHVNCPRREFFVIRCWHVIYSVAERKWIITCPVCQQYLSCPAMRMCIPVPPTELMYLFTFNQYLFNPWSPGSIIVGIRGCAWRSFLRTPRPLKRWNTTQRTPGARPASVTVLPGSPARPSCLLGWLFFILGIVKLPGPSPNPHAYPSATQIIQGS